MFCVGGARGIFRSNISYYSSVPSSTTVTYEGLFNSTFFKLNSKEEKKAINLEISLASVINPISNENEIWLGTLLKSKYDGQKINKLIDLSIALDISGSMSGSRINMAKKSLIQLIQKLNDEDNITISIFNNESKPIFPYQKVSELKKLDYITEIEKLHAQGGTDILKAFKCGYNLMSKENCNKNKIRRIIIITDMEDRINEELTKFCEKISLEGIYITILGISSEFRTDLAEMTSHIKGANYVVIKEIKDINKYLVEDFEYLCFQNATDLSLEVISPYLKIERIVGSGKEGIEEKYEKSDWNLEQHKFYSDDFKQKIFFLLLYFNRKNMILPKPVILTLCEFMVPGVKKEISKILTSFPSQLKILGENKIYVEGGMILLRLDKSSIRNENIMKFEINYKNELEDKKESLDMEYSFKKELIEKTNYFSDTKIETALSLFYFAKFNRRFMKICNNENKKKKYNKEYIKRAEFKDEKEKVKNFMKDNLFGVKNDNLNDELIKEYLENMDKNAEKAIKYVNEKKDENEKINGGGKRKMIFGKMFN
jgi:Mg-chelatase subunit ChlD